jgi:hypothetical protein
MTRVLVAPRDFAALVGDKQSSASAATDPGMVCRVRILADFSDRTSRYQEGSIPSLVREHSVELDQVLIRRSRLIDLRDGFREWISSKRSVTIELTSEPGQRLVLRVDRDPRVITTPGHPAFSVTYSGIGLDVSAITIIDESCIRLAIEDLQTSLAALEAVSAELTSVGRVQIEGTYD